MADEKKVVVGKAEGIIAIVLVVAAFVLGLLSL